MLKFIWYKSLNNDNQAGFEVHKQIKYDIHKQPKVFNPPFKLKYNNKNLLFLFSMFSKWSAGCFIPVQEMNDSDDSL